MIKKKIDITKILFSIYCLLLIWIVLFKLSFQISDLYRPKSLNFIPFYYDNNTSIHLKEVMENILLFIPLGLYLKMMEKSNKISILIGFILSLLLETIQYIFSIGSSDITDIITNTLGTVLGVLFYILLVKIFKNNEKIKKILTILATITTILFILFLSIVFIDNY